VLEVPHTQLIWFVKDGANRLHAVEFALHPDPNPQILNRLNLRI
jgi:hypothetical protein